MKRNLQVIQKGTLGRLKIYSEGIYFKRKKKGRFLEEKKKFLEEKFLTEGQRVRKFRLKHTLQAGD